MLVLPVHFHTLVLSLLAEVVWLSWPMRKRTLASPVHHTYVYITHIYSYPCALVYIFILMSRCPAVRACFGVVVCELVGV